MREAAFVKQNKEKWIAFERFMQGMDTTDPDTLADSYIQLTNDLAYAQTYYPDSKTLLYLNSLATQAHQQIYVNKPEDKNRIISFWKTEFPLFFRQYHKTLFYTFLIFLLPAVLGFISAIVDDSFVRLIMGDGYVNMTIENIQKGDPMDVYDQESFYMFVRITLNNIQVSFFAYVLGIFFSLGTGYILFRNGIMVGAFFGMLYAHGVGYEALKTVMLHGTIELWAIVIAGCAGIVMGNSILFPGTYKRRVSFIRGAKDGLKIVISAVPFFILAGFIEGFITKYSNMPVWLAFSIIGASLALILWYYIFYPIYLNKKHA